MTNVEKVEKKIRFHETKIEKISNKINTFINTEEVVKIGNEIATSTKYGYVDGWDILDKMGCKSCSYDKNYYYEVCDIADSIEAIIHANHFEMPKAIESDARIAKREAKKAEEKRIIESVNNPVIDTFLANWKKSFLEYAKTAKEYKYESAERLNEIADREVEMKKLDLIARIQEKAGAILDASYLTIGSNGSLNGKVIGEKKSVWVETILAGGYNIQCLHYRVLVK